MITRVPIIEEVSSLTDCKQPLNKGWDSAALSAEFLSRAKDAELYLGEIRPKIRLNTSYERVNDEALAKFYVYNYLHGRDFLQTRATLLPVLHAFLAMDVAKPTEAFDFNRFLEFRRVFVQGLIHRFEHESQ